MIEHAGLGCREVGVLPQLLASDRAFPQSLKLRSAHFDDGNEEITLTMAAITVAAGHMVKLKM